MKSLWKKVAHIARNEQVAGSIPIVGFTFQALTRHPTPRNNPSVDKRCQGRQPYHKAETIIQIATLCLAILILVACATCRKTAVEDAHYWQSKGYETRIAVYKVGTDGLIAGLGIWQHHAQAQVFKNNRWRWAMGDVLSDESVYSIDKDIWYWQVGIYEAYLKQQGAYN